MDFHKEIRITYMAAVPHSMYTGLIWILSAWVGDYYSKGKAIWFLILAGSFIFAFGELLKKLMHIKNVLSKENNLPQMFTLAAFTVPLSYPIIYFACKANINYFYPTFMIIVGAHYLLFVYGYGLKTFGLLAFVLIGGGASLGYYFPENFSTGGYFTGLIIWGFALLHFFILKSRNEIMFDK